MWGTCGKKAKPFINNSLVLNIVILLGLFQDPMRFGHSMKECEKHNENEEKKTRMTLSLSFSFCFCDPKVEKSNFYRDLKGVLDWEEPKKPLIKSENQNENDVKQKRE